MGILDDIKKLEPVSDKVFTTKDLIKAIKSMKFGGKGNKDIKKYKSGIINNNDNSNNINNSMSVSINK